MSKNKQLNAHIILISFLLVNSLSLTGTQIRDVCHCDLNSNFCDFECCCDLDCSSTVADSCFRTKSIQLCIEKKYYYAINTNFYQQNNCYFYNSTNSIVEPVSINTPILTQIVNSNSPPSAISTASTPYVGYQAGAIFEIGSQSTFSLVDGSGNCLTSVGVGRSQQLSFGRSVEVSCVCSGCTSSIPLYTQFVNKTVNKYFGDSSNNLMTVDSIPTDTTTLIIRLLIANYGKQKIKYIDSVIAATEQLSNTNTRKLIIKFEQLANAATAQNTQAPFFPQIPKDMFYPIFMS